MNAAQVTEAHIARVRAFGYTTEKGVQMAAQFIANNEAKLATEREKVRTLREALDEAQSCGGLTGAIFMQARAALAATEGKP